jgi:hypothetical protein
LSLAAWVVERLARVASMAARNESNGYGVRELGVGVENGDFVLAITGIDARVVVVLGHQQIRGRAGVGRHHRSRHNGGGIIPAEGAGNFEL